MIEQVIAFMNRVLGGVSRVKEKANLMVSGMRLIPIAVIAMLSGCADEGQSTNTPKASGAQPVSASDPVFVVPMQMKPVYRIVDGTPETEGSAKYLRARIVVPAGLDRATLDANIRHAAKTLYDRDHPTGMFVFANKEGTDTRGAYTAGRCDFHPITKDKHDPTITLEDCEAKIDIAEGYFQTTVPEPKSTGDPKLDRVMGIDKAAWRSAHRKLTEAQRRRIYYEVGSVNDRATAESLKRYPDNFDAGQKAILDRIGKQNQLEEDLVKRYETDIAKIHHISYAEVRAIRSEGRQANWPLPPSK